MEVDIAFDVTLLEVELSGSLTLAYIYHLDYSCDLLRTHPYYFLSQDTFFHVDVASRKLADSAFAVEHNQLVVPKACAKGSSFVVLTERTVTYEANEVSISVGFVLISQSGWKSRCLL